MHHFVVKIPYFQKDILQKNHLDLKYITSKYTLRSFYLLDCSAPFTIGVVTNADADAAAIVDATAAAQRGMYVHMYE